MAKIKNLSLTLQCMNAWQKRAGEFIAQNFLLAASNKLAAIETCRQELVAQGVKVVFNKELKTWQVAN